MSSIFDDAVSKARSAADITAKKAGEIVELTKANVKIFDTQNTMDKVYIEIGKMVYNASKGKGDYAEEIDQKIAVIDELSEKLSTLRDQVATLRGNKRCQHCGKENTVENSFCGGCGSALDD